MVLRAPGEQHARIIARLDDDLDIVKSRSRNIKTRVIAGHTYEDVFHRLSVKRPMIIAAPCRTALRCLAARYLWWYFNTANRDLRGAVVELVPLVGRMIDLRSLKKKN